MTRKVFRNKLLLKRGKIKTQIEYISDEIRTIKVNIMYLFAIKLMYLSIVLLNGT